MFRRVRIDQLIGQKPTQTGYESSEFGYESAEYETFVGAKRLDSGMVTESLLLVYVSGKENM